MKNRIALCMEYSVHQQGGTEVLVRILAENLGPEYEVVLVTGDTPESFQTSHLSKMVAAHVYWPAGEPTGSRSRALASALVAHQVRVAHFHFGGTFMWGNRIFGRCPIHYVARRGISCVSTVHLVHPPLEGYIGPQRPLWVKLALFPLAWGAKCRTLARTAAEFAVSRHDLQILKGCSGPYASRQRLIYHSAVRETEIVPGSSQREPLILSVGTIGPRKGQAILVEAFDQVAGKFPDWVLIIAGRWDDADPYSRRVRLAIEQSPYQKRIRVPGRIPDSEIRGLMQRSAIFAMPSLEEGLGLSLQEALLSGCPAVGTRAGGIPELIDHEVNGLLVEPGNVSAFAEGLARLMSNAARRAELGERARESVLQKGMTLERMIAAYARIYSQLLTTNHPTGSGRQ